MYKSSERLLEVFFDNPSGRFHVRELARITGLHPNTVIKLAKGLVKRGIIKRKQTKLLVEFIANTDGEAFVRAKRLHNIRKIYDSGLIEFLDEFYNAPPAIVLYGSYSLGEDVERSDIDIAVITERRASPDVDRFEKKLRRGLHILNTDLKATPKELRNNIINGIVLRGRLRI